MPTHVALLRAVNVGGYNTVKMSELCALFSKLGLGNTKSLLNSGNVVFDGGAKDTKALETLLEAATTKRFGVTVDYMVRTRDEWKKLIAKNPFTGEAKTDPQRLGASVLKSAPARGAEQALRDVIVARGGRETARVIGSCAYIFYPDGFGKASITPAIIEKALGTRGTARNWNTVLKIAALL